MPEEYLQAAFEIKASCDEISRRILRWHWESKPGAHSFDSLLEHIRRRQEESPAYYGHMPDVGRKTSWQQLDPTLCMRVLLDPENDAAQPLDLLGNTAHPGASRRACNAVRTARNEAAHASDRSSGGRAAILFDEAVECVEDAYAGTAFSEKELAKYYQLSREYLRRCGVGGQGTGSAPRSAACAGRSGPRSAGLSHRGGPSEGRRSPPEGQPQRRRHAVPGERSPRPLSRRTQGGSGQGAGPPFPHLQRGGAGQPGGCGAGAGGAGDRFGSAGSPDGRAALFVRTL